MERHGNIWIIILILINHQRNKICPIQQTESGIQIKNNNNNNNKQKKNINNKQQTAKKL
jgi:hypothetical protein